MHPDIDTLRVIALLDEAVTMSGLAQGEFAVALGTSASRFSTYRTGRTKPSAAFCFRASRVARALLEARQSRLMSAPDTAAAVRDAADEAWAWRMLLQGRDHLRLMLERADGSEAAWEAAPGRIGSIELDTLLAALTRHEFERASVRPPAWAVLVRLESPWTPDHPFVDAGAAVAQTPDFLRDLNIFVPARDLVTS